MNAKSRSIIAITATAATFLITFSACATQQRTTPQTTRTRLQQQMTPGNLGNNMDNNLGNNATGNTGMRFDVTPETNRTTTGANIGTGNNNNGRNGNFLGMGNNNNRNGNLLGMDNNNNGNGNFLGMGNNGGQAPQTAAGPSDRSKAASIKRGLESMPGINNVDVVVMGDTAVVSYGRKNGADNANVTNQTITNRVKQIDNTITNVYVSDSADIGSQIRRLSNDMINNKPLDEITNSFNKLINKINPNTNARS
ncbi:YhcN/YlaJ family sporulation lipoprotein [Clostridium thermosuccinogenes]|uniref:YhcN/YlaJ family sporulation lipoprotein n=1 Tax=Clostridium thermosuccinogenes TaxID=84032 RepID=UPI000CCC302A|nr:YhcN/YlaJ family sporulation lipoprotein [Pseudoclostridium thermosuccinogenes]PNT92415.1 hypothetical protein CDQ83_02220 [Pseudoclostridium thermosuccinogenes]